MTGPKNEILTIPSGALVTHELAGVLGSPLESGKMMYNELQNQYLTSDANDYIYN